MELYNFTIKLHEINHAAFCFLGDFTNGFCPHIQKKSITTNFVAMLFN
jgi:hypothetical protein